MAEFRLMYSPASPFVRKVMVTLIETGQRDEVELVESEGSPTAPDPRRAMVNPLGKVPALARPDGPALFDSRVICRYLDARAAGGLYPESRLWEVLTLEALADGIMEAAVLMVYERRCRTPEEVSEAWVAAQWAKVAAALDAAEGHWTSHLAGRLTAAQVALGCALGYLDLRHAARDWRRGRPTLAAWEEGFAARPSMAATRAG
jgi:glutathione S-transferase